jgi:hypothetical protein
MRNQHRTGYALFAEHRPEGAIVLVVKPHGKAIVRELW